MIKKSDLAEEALKKFKNSSTRAIVKYLMNEYPLLFDDYESTRMIVRVKRGLHANAKKYKTVIPQGNVVNIKGIPKSKAEVKKPYQIPSQYVNTVGFGDTHFPYHEEHAIEAMVEYALDNKVDSFVHGGDMLDFHQKSRFLKDPTKPNTKKEFEVTIQFWEWFRTLFPTQPVFFLEGNHDLRYKHWLMGNAPQLFGDEYYHLEQRIGFDRFNIKLIPENQLVKYNQLVLSHGHKIVNGIFAPVNPARGAFLKAKDSIAIWHTHQHSEHTEPTINSKLITCYSVGCMCELRPAYNPFTNKNAHGFLHLQRDSSFYHARNIRILNGKIL